VFAAGAAASSSFQASDASASASSAGEKKSGNWDFLLKSKDNLRTPDKWSQDSDAKPAAAAASSESNGGLNSNYFSATDLLVPGSDADTFSGKKSLVEKANNMASRVSDDQSSAVLNALGAASSAFSAIPSPPMRREEAPVKLPYSNADMPTEAEASENKPAPLNLAATGSMMNEADSQLGELKQADPSSFALVKQMLAKNAAGQLPEMHKDSSDEQAQIEELLGGSGQGGAVAAAHASGGKNWLNWKPSMVDF